MNTARPLLSMIVAAADNNVIGKDNELPWRLSGDLRHFKEVTMNRPIVMGRKTWVSIGKPLPGRSSIVVTSQRGYEAQGAVVVHSLDEAIEAAGAAEEVMIIGGARLYEEALPRAQRIYLTEVHAEVDGDTFFPPLDRDEWREVSRERFESDERNEYPYSFVLLERR